jgi:adenosylcobinamide-phosphate synthase
MSMLLFSSLSLAVAGLAVLVERVAGWPAPIDRRLGHPVQWAGALIAMLDGALNRDGDGAARRRLMGVLALAVVLGLVAAVTVPLALWLRSFAWGWVVEALLAVPLICQRDLARHVAAVERGLGESLAAGRAEVRHIIGRDPQALDESGVACGAIESLAENTCDGIVAPLVWTLVLGLPGAALYKAVNTADSMLGHRTPRHLHFGWAAARLDDLANLVPARLTALLFAAAAAVTAGADPGNAWRAARRDAPRHVSPNAGWPEAAVAGALGIRLGGPRAYGGRAVELAFMGDGRAVLEAADIGRALGLYFRALALLGLAAALAVGVGGFS